MIANMYLHGQTQANIGRSLGLSQSFISDELKAIREEWRSSCIRDFDARQVEELAKIDNLERTYWTGWERSIKDREKLIIEETTGEKASTKERTETEGQAGDPRFLQGVRDCIAERCKILGIYAPQEIKDVTPPRVVEVIVESREEAMTVQELLANARNN